MKVVCIGNSIVAGFPFPKSRSFPSLLRGETGWEIINKGISGNTTRQVLERFQPDVLRHRPDAAVILTGTNDFIYETAGPGEAMENLRAMVDVCREEGIVPYLMTPLSVNGPQASLEWKVMEDTDYGRVDCQLEGLAAMIRALGAHKACILIDSRVEYKKFGQYIDGIHPTMEGQALLARIVKDVLMDEGSR